MGLWHLVIWLPASLLAGALLVVAVALTIAVIVLRVYFDRLRIEQRRSLGKDRRPIVGFFHPHSTGGGGGERVLWTMLDALMKDWPEADFTIYTHWKESGRATHEAVQKIVSDKFGITLPRPVSIVQLHGVAWIEPSSYPRLTLLLQSLGALPLAWEALSAQVPDIFIDSMGLALSYPLASICCRCLVAEYVHYPVVSSDMLMAVRERRAKFNNSAAVAHSEVLTQAKLVYYRLFAKLYGWAGRQSDVVMVNSSWTKGHIVDIWGLPHAKVHRVFPPCNVSDLIPLSDGPLKSSATDLAIVSVAQFRPEKDHPLQLRAFKLVLDKRRAAGASSAQKVRLCLIGGARNQEDLDRVAALRALAKELDIADNVEFHVNLPYSGLLTMLERGAIGLHTMRDEHFGIVVVEYMASGCIPVAHNSAGPKMDIVGEGCGFLAETEGEFADRMVEVLAMSPSQLAEMRQRGREASKLFSEEVFSESVCQAMSPLRPAAARS